MLGDKWWLTVKNIIMDHTAWRDSFAEHLLGLKLEKLAFSECIAHKNERMILGATLHDFLPFIPRYGVGSNAFDAMGFVEKVLKENPEWKVPRVLSGEYDIEKEVVVAKPKKEVECLTLRTRSDSSPSARCRFRLQNTGEARGVRRKSVCS
jgi:hypothetical protein